MIISQHARAAQRIDRSGTFVPRLTRRVRNGSAAIKVADPQRSVADQVAESTEAARAWAAIEDLSPHQRAALTLKLGEDMMLAQIGEIMGNSEGAVKLLVHRGIIGVRQRLAIANHLDVW